MVTILRPSSRGACPRVTSLLLAFLAGCGGGGEVTKPVPASVASVLVAPIPAILYVGATIQLTVTTMDAAGSSLAGRVITFASSNPAVATVSSSGSVTAVGVGSAGIHVVSEGKATDVGLLVAMVPVVSVLTAPATATIGLGGTVALSATPRDSAGAMLFARTVTWTSSAPQVATVSVTGSVTGIAAGTATIRATVDGKAGESVITVSSATAPVITSITPAQLSSGITATITGSGFGSLTAGNTVTIDGATAIVTAASATQRSVLVPALPCTPAPVARVQVLAQGIGGTALQAVRAGTPLAITSGAPRLLFQPIAFLTSAAILPSSAEPNAVNANATGRSLHIILFAYTANQGQTPLCHRLRHRLGRRARRRYRG